MIPSKIKLPDYRLPDTTIEVRRTLRKMWKYLTDHSDPLISVSGGSDSDCIVHMLCKYLPELVPKCHFVFVDTGLEYDATKRHLVELEDKYSISIKTIRGKSVVTAVRQNGIPVLSKEKTHKIAEWINGSDNARFLIFEKEGRFAFSKKQRKLAQYIHDNNIKVSARCCDVSKKNPLHKYMREHSIDLDITGERKAEGGQRAIVHKSCFEQHDDKASKFMPLWWWSDVVKQDFKNTEEIRYSDCYEVYGMKRTGCVGCPFGLNLGRDLLVMSQYEPQLFKACMNVFGEAYRLTDLFKCRRRRVLPDPLQMEMIKLQQNDLK